MKTIPLLALLLLAGCASGGSELPTRVMTAGEAVDFRINAGPEGSLASFNASPEAVWRALPRVFEQLQIPVGHVDANARVIGNQRYVVRRTLGGEPVQRYFNCGSGVTGPLTSTHDIAVSILVKVMPDGEFSLALELEPGTEEYKMEQARRDMRPFRFPLSEPPAGDKETTR